MSLILTQQKLEGTIDWPDGCQVLAVDGDEPAEQDVRWIPPAADHLAYAIFTSGTTGRPKGVSITHRAAVNTIMDINQRFEVGPGDRVFALSSLSFDLSVYDVFGALAVGAAIVFPEPWAHRDPEHWLQVLNQCGVTIWNSVPALMELLVTHESQTPWPAGLRAVLLSGDWLPLDIADRIRERVPAARVFSLGGATEGSIWSIAYEVGGRDPQWRSVPYGKPLTNQRFHVLDHALAPCPVHVPGELYIAGLGLARDYYRDLEKTSAAFITFEGTPVPGGPQPGERLYRTGDWGRYLPDGNLEFLGREDLQVKIQGYRIELGEIESVLGRHPAVAAAVAIAAGEGRTNRRLAAFYVLHEDVAAPDEAALIEYLAHDLPEYMVPGIFTALEQLPLTANGKIDRKELSRLALHRDDQVAGKVAPRTKIEKDLAEIWCELLELNSLGVHDALFDLGGNSLVAIRMLSQLRAVFQVEVSLQSLFAHPTVAGLAEEIVRLKAEAGETGRLMDDGINLVLEHNHEDRFKPFPLSDIQQAYLLGRMSNLELGNVAAHAYFEIEVDSDDPARIETAWLKLIERHDMLRTVFHQDGTQQVLEQFPDWHLPVEDLTVVEEDEARQRLDAVRERMSHQVLPTNQWPLFEIRVSRMTSARIRIHLSFDLLIADAWSAQLIFLEFAQLRPAIPTLQLDPLEVTASAITWSPMEKAARTTAVYQRVPSAYWLERVPTRWPPRTATPPGPRSGVALSRPDASSSPRGPPVDPRYLATSPAGTGCTKQRTHPLRPLSGRLCRGPGRPGRASPALHHQRHHLQPPAASTARSTRHGGRLHQFPDPVGRRGFRRPPVISSYVPAPSRNNSGRIWTTATYSGVQVVRDLAAANGAVRRAP